MKISTESEIRHFVRLAATNPEMNVLLTDLWSCFKHQDRGFPSTPMPLTAVALNRLIALHDEIPVVKDCLRVLLEVMERADDLVADPMEDATGAEDQQTILALLQAQRDRIKGCPY